MNIDISIQIIIVSIMILILSIYNIIRSCLDHSYFKYLLSIVIRFIPLVLSFLTCILLLNILFLVARNAGIVIVSPLSDDDALILIATLLASGLIAYMQYRIQKSIEKKKEDEDNLQKEFHLQETKSERIKSMNLHKRLKAKAWNFNIHACRLKYPQLYEIPYKVKSKYPNFMVRIYTTDGLLCPHYFSSKKEPTIKISIDKTRLDDNFVYVKKEPDNIEFYFYNISACEELKKFLLAPQIPYDCRSKINSISLEITFYGEDTSYAKTKEQEKYRNFNYKLNLQIKPDSGYQEYGEFNIMFSETNIEKIEDT